jgi:ABC-2 type transport system permease protein
MLLAWIAGVVFFCVAFVPAMPSFVGTQDESMVLGEMMKNPAMIAMCGIIYGDEPSMGILYTQLMMVWSALLVGVMNILLVIRHTRSDEDEGRLEVLRALPTGRQASLAAVSTLMVGINVLIAVATALLMTVFQVESINLRGSIVYAAALGACGLFFAAMTMVVVQLVHTARGAIGLSLGLLGAFYLLRAYGDVSSETAARLSPLGLILRTYPFYENKWWPVIVLVLIAGVLVVCAFALGMIRDLGQGLLPALRRTRAHGPKSLSGEWGLTWRLNRGMIIAWAVTVFVFSAGYASVMGDMESFLESSPLYQQLMGVGLETEDINNSVVAMLVMIMSIVGTIPVLAIAFKLRSEENKGRLDYILGKTVSRWKLFGGYAGLVVLVAILMQLLTAVGFWGVAQTVMPEPFSATFVTKVALNYLPALIFFGGLGLALVGWLKKFTWVGWAYLGGGFLLTFLGSMLDLPEWMGKLTPFGLLPRWPTEAFSLTLWLVVLVAGLGLMWIGSLGFRRRDVTA